MVRRFLAVASQAEFKSCPSWKTPSGFLLPASEVGLAYDVLLLAVLQICKPVWQLAPQVGNETDHCNEDNDPSLYPYLVHCHCFYHCLHDHDLVC